VRTILKRDRKDKGKIRKKKKDLNKIAQVGE
jgi:hypothetical protein